MFGYGGYGMGGMYGGGAGYGGGSGFNAWTWIILILIVLQWFRVGRDRDDCDPERDLMRNGGLFIIAIFLLVACGCFKREPIMPPISPIRYSGC